MNNCGRKILLAGIVVAAIASAASAMGVQPGRSDQEYTKPLPTEAASPQAYHMRRIENRERYALELYEHKLADGTRCLTTVYPGLGVSTTCAWNSK